MCYWLRFIVGTGLLLATHVAHAQLSITPQFNTALPVGDTREYGNPRAGFGLEVGYRLSEHWSVVAAYDRYRFELTAGPEEFNISSSDPVIAALLNLSNLLSLDMSADSWNGGVRFSVPVGLLTPYVGVEGSTNLITAQGLGLTVSRRYWGVAPVVGLEVTVAPRWRLRADTRLQTIFIRDDIPFVDELVDETLMFVPLQAGVVYRIDW